MLYLPPARIDDFSRSDQEKQLRQAWHSRVKRQIDQYRSLPRFLDPLDADDTATTDSFSWSGFPRVFDAWLDIENHPDRLDRAHRSAELLNPFVWVKLEDRFRTVPAQAGLELIPNINGKLSVADAFTLQERPQDEYLEWHVVRDPVGGGVRRIDFTVEPPEYWETLAEGDRSLAAQLYSEFLKTDVPADDLFFKGDTFCAEIVKVGDNFRIAGYVRLFPNSDDFSKGQYNRWNRWNTERGAVHLTQRANTLFAEINLAARAGQRFAVRKELGDAVDRFTLTACGGYGAVNRNSDPTIGEGVNTLALSGFKCMVSNPVGLYVGEIDLSGFRDPNNTPVPQEQILTIHRGSQVDKRRLPRILRFSVHPPTDADYMLDQCTFDGHSLSTGGPIARKTTVIIHGVAMPSTSNHPVVNCDAQLCEHATKRPKYFLTKPLTDVCPAADDREWTNEPVLLVPDLLLNVDGDPGTDGPRSSGSRS